MFKDQKNRKVQSIYRNIILTGPESAGKTSLAKALAKKYQYPLISEYARTYLGKYGSIYGFIDLLNIAKQQNLMQQEMLSKHKMTILDTANLVLIIWSKVKFGKVHPYILQQFENDNIGLYVLCKPNIDWEYDPLRENREDRDVLYSLYKESLIAFHKPFIEVSGTILERIKQIEDYIELSRYLAKH